MENHPPCLPKNRNWVSTYLTVHTPERAIELYTKVFGFKKKEILRDKHSDRILYAVLSYQNYDIMMGPDVAFGGRTGSIAPVAAQSPSPVVMYVYVDDIEAIHKKVSEAKLEIIVPVSETFWGDKMFKVKCTEGYYWDFAQNIASPNAETSIPENLYYEELDNPTAPLSS